MNLVLTELRNFKPTIQFGLKQLLKILTECVRETVQSTLSRSRQVNRTGYSEPYVKNRPIH